MIKSIDGAVFSRMMLSAAAEIDLNKQKVNELNVFPVPDGDTGTNLLATAEAAGPASHSFSSNGTRAMSSRSRSLSGRTAS